MINVSWRYPGQNTWFWNTSLVNRNVSLPENIEKLSFWCHIVAFAPRKTILSPALAVDICACSTEKCGSFGALSPLGLRAVAHRHLVRTLQCFFVARMGPCCCNALPPDTMRCVVSTCCRAEPGIPKRRIRGWNFFCAGTDFDFPIRWQLALHWGGVGWAATVFAFWVQPPHVFHSLHTRCRWPFLHSHMCSHEFPASRLNELYLVFHGVPWFVMVF